MTKEEALSKVKGLLTDLFPIEEYDKVEEIVKALEQPKTGHWIEEFNELEGEVRFTCSRCGKYQLFGTDYCYNCGAKMIESQESEMEE